MGRVKPISPGDLPSEPSVPEWVIVEVNDAIRYDWKAEINKAVIEEEESSITNRLKGYLRHPTKFEGIKRLYEKEGWLVRRVVIPEDQEILYTFEKREPGWIPSR